MAEYSIPFVVDAIDYDKAMSILADTHRFGLSPVLESVEDMLKELGNPHTYYEVIQIAGTNGKTSTSRYTAQILQAMGKKTALYTSPELVSMCERMEIDTKPISQAVFAHGIAVAHQAAHRVNAQRCAQALEPYDITQFDLLTVAALVVFAEAGIDVAVLECGMGGRWDATTAACAQTVCITGIGLDHTKILGDTFEKIAAEKAAIIKEDTKCVLGVGCAVSAGAQQVLLKRCADVHVMPTLLHAALAQDDPVCIERNICCAFDDMPTTTYIITHHPQTLADELVLDVSTPYGMYRAMHVFAPVYQAANIACAISLCEAHLGRPLDQAIVQTALEALVVPGRFELICKKPLQLIDACHNPQSLESFLHSLQELEPIKEKRPACLCAVFKDKDYVRMAQLIAEAFDEIYVVQTDSQRCLDASCFAEVLQEQGGNVVDIFTDVPHAKKALSQTSFVACGTISLAAELKRF